MKGWYLGLCALTVAVYAFFAAADWKQRNWGWFYGDIAMAVFCVVVISIIFTIAARGRKEK